METFDDLQRVYDLRNEIVSFDFYNVEKGRNLFYFMGFTLALREVNIFNIRQRGQILYNLHIYHSLINNIPWFFSLQNFTLFTIVKKNVKFKFKYAIHHPEFYVTSSYFLIKSLEITLLRYWEEKYYLFSTHLFIHETTWKLFWIHNCS